MKQSLLKRTLLLLCALVVGSGSVWADDVAYKTIQFGSSYNSEGVQNYTSTWTATKDGFTVSLENFNNNNNGWDAVKCGRKNNASVATITTSSTIDKVISKVVVTVDAVTTDKVNSTKLEASTDNTFKSGVVSVSPSISTGDVTYSLSSNKPSENNYYRLTFDCASGSSNGLVTISKIVFYYDKPSTGATTITTIDDSGITNTDLATGTSAGAFSASVVYGSPATDVPEASVSWSCNPTGIVDVAADGTVTLIKTGTTTITASYAGVENTYQSSSDTYELTVTNSNAGDGTQAKPYTVAEARAAIDAGTGITNVYVKGIVCTAGFSLSSGQLNYYISDDGTNTNQLESYKGKNLNNTNFTATTDIQVGDIVTIYGTLTKYNSTYEFGEGNYLTSFKRKPLPELSFAQTSFTVLPNADDFVPPTLTNTEGVTVAYSSNNENVAVVDANSGEVIIGEVVGTATITASFAGNDDYKANTASYTITTQKGDAELSFAVASYTVNANASFTAPTLTNPHNLTVTYSSTDEDVAVVDENTGQIVIGDKEATTTITATFAGNTQYNSDAASYTIEVTATPTHTVTFSINGNTDATGTIAEGAAINFPENPTSLGGLSFVGWSLNAVTPSLVTMANETMGNDDVTYYAVWGKANTVTKTCDFEEATNNDWTIDGPTRDNSKANNGSYAGKINSNNTYVTFKTKVKPLSFSFAFTRTSTNSNYNVYIETSSDNSAWSAVETYAMGSFSNGTFDTKSHKFDGNTELYVRFHCYNTTAVRYVDDVTITYLLGYENLTTSISNVEAIVSNLGYATFASDYALDFTGASIKAYIAKADGTSAVTFTQVNKVPAGTGLLLIKEGGETEDIPALVGDDTDDVTGNVFVKGTGSAVATTENEGKLHNYILNNGSQGLGFYQANDQTVAANRAYIQIDQSTNPVKGFIALPGNEDNPTAVKTVKSACENGVMFNLAGQRVNKAQKGVFIVNGKKVIK